MGIGLIPAVTPGFCESARPRIEVVPGAQAPSRPHIALIDRKPETNCTKFPKRQLAWLKLQLAQSKLDDVSRRALLAGRPPAGTADTGPVVCACFGVGLVAIEKLIASGAAVTVEEVGAHLKAGTNCGSCQPEIKQLIAATNGAKVLETAT